MNKLSALAISAAAVFLAASPAWAAEANRVGISVSQSVFAFDAFPGETHSVTLSVKNTFDGRETVTLEAEDIVWEDNNVPRTAAGLDETEGLKSWIKADNVNWRMAPGESRPLHLTINVPANATVGSHSAAVLIRALPEITWENFQEVIVSGRVGVYLLVNVKGEISGKGSISRFAAPFLSGKKATFEVDYQNQGNIHYVPHGELKIDYLLASRSENIPVEKHFVFPGKKYAFAEQWELPTLFWAYRAEATFIDGEGAIQRERRWVFGSFFPLTLLGGAAGIMGLWKLLQRRRMAKRSAEKEFQGATENGSLSDCSYQELFFILAPWLSGEKG